MLTHQTVMLIVDATLLAVLMMVSQFISYKLLKKENEESMGILILLGTPTMIASVFPYNIAYLTMLLISGLIIYKSPRPTFKLGARISIIFIVISWVIHATNVFKP